MEGYVGARRPVHLVERTPIEELAPAHVPAIVCMGVRTHVRLRVGMCACVLPPFLPSGIEEALTPRRGQPSGLRFDAGWTSKATLVTIGYSRNAMRSAIGIR